VTAPPPRLFDHLKLGDTVVVEPVLANTGARQVVGTIGRVATSYLFVRVQGWKDSLRVARASGRGTTQSTQYQISIPTPGRIDEIRRTEAVERLHGALVDVHTRLRAGIQGIVAGTPTERLVQLDALVRELLAPKR
jgi:hypothetical protein